MLEVRSDDLRQMLKRRNSRSLWKGRQGLLFRRDPWDCSISPTIVHRMQIKERLQEFASMSSYKRKNWNLKLRTKKKNNIFRTRTLLEQTRSITSAAPITDNKWLDDLTDQSSQFADRSAQKYIMIKFFYMINFDMLCIIEDETTKKNSPETKFLST